VIFKMRPMQNAPFCSIPASGSNFNPQNTQCIPACPVGPADRTGVVKIFALTRGIHAPRPGGQLDSCPNLLSCRFALVLNKIERFSKVSQRQLQVSGENF